MMQIYELTYQGAKIGVKSRGAELCSFVPKNGTEYIWQGDENIWGGHSPILFPIVCALKNDTVKIDGKPYHMRKHGFLMQQEFQLVERGEDFLEFVFHATPETKEMYPFSYAVYIKHRIWKDGFETTFRVENLDEKTIPMCLGGHPGFIIPREEGEAFSDYILQFPYVENGKNAMCPSAYLIEGEEYFAPLAGSDTLALKHSYFDKKDALMLMDLKSREVSLIHKDTKKGLRFYFPGFDVLGVWTKPGANADYICLEPWCGLPAYETETGNFEDKPFVKMVAPKEVFAVSYKMEVVA
ncbi:MAG: aldose 1-epimerase family protein [Christensenellaceae bacterium]